ncbi:hypothetical protein MAJHIDBO_01276 [Propionibacterium freudenreichii subsp. shermanii]|nr:hypothetical protein MAJHIDBO_01276 [Propionibacterium freudenreichii subsp. shermanii]SPS09071.1 hypothetical protein MAJHIDBO_01276 [Propionibacterium freudenreichii subsp. shermanii]
MFQGVTALPRAGDLGDDMAYATAQGLVAEPRQCVGKLLGGDASQQVHAKFAGGLLAIRAAGGILPIDQCVLGARVDHQQPQAVGRHVEGDLAHPGVMAEVDEQGMAWQAAQGGRLVEPPGGCTDDVVLGATARVDQRDAGCVAVQQAEVEQPRCRTACGALDGGRTRQSGADRHIRGGGQVESMHCEAPLAQRPDRAGHIAQPAAGNPRCHVVEADLRLLVEVQGRDPHDVVVAGAGGRIGALGQGDRQA